MSWEVRIRGDAAELRILAESFTGPGVTIVEHADGFFLGGICLEASSDPQAAQDMARELVTRISGSARLRIGSRRPLDVDHVIQVDGTNRHLTVLPGPAVVELRVLPPTRTMTQTDCFVIERHLPADRVVEDILKAERHESVAMALRLWSLPDAQLRDPSNILEIIQRDGFRLTKQEKAAAGRVDGSANHPDSAGDTARHAAPPWDAPDEENRVNILEARGLVRPILLRWLATK